MNDFNLNQKAKYFIPGLVFAAIFGVLAITAVPGQAKAFEAARLIDPFCLFACDDDEEQQTYYINNINRINKNSNVNSPNGTVNVGNKNVNTGPTYYDPAYPNYPPPPPQTAPLSVSCYATPGTVRIGETVQWIGVAYGGTGSYSYSWSGTDGLSGSGRSIYKSYGSAGSKTASLQVTSGNQSKYVNCDWVTVYDDRQYDPPYYPPYDPYYPPYNPPYEQQLYVSCSPDITYTTTGSRVTWRAYASGGTGYYNYSWSGTDNLWGTGQTVSNIYYNPGTKYAYVQVRSGSRYITQNCGTVNVNSTVAYNPPYYPPAQPPVYGNDLDIGCFADPDSARVNQPVNWTAEVSGGYGPYRYSWSGTDGLTGSSNSIVKYYSTAGAKSAVVTITSSDGRTGTRACSNTATIKAAYTAPRPSTPAPTTPVTPVQPTTTDTTGLSAASIFSLANVPWGWVALLVILVLFITVLYLLFNRQKI